MNTFTFTSIAFSIALSCASVAQSRRADTAPEQAARIEAARDARLQRIRSERPEQRKMALEAGRAELRNTIARDQEFMAVWAKVDPKLRAKAISRDLAERVSRSPDWPTQNRAQRIKAVTDFITNYQKISADRKQLNMNAAIGLPSAAYPPKQDVARLVVSVPQLIIAAFPETEVPDLFTINRKYYWTMPHGQWMNQMLKDIDAAKAKGDIQTYNDLTVRYSVWAEKYLRR